MKGGCGEKRGYSLDGGVLIALALGEEVARKLAEEITWGEVDAYTHELALTEMLYILCRKAGWATALEKKSQLAKSGLIHVIPTETLMEEAAKLKCERTLSLADCFTIALAKIFRCKALFVKPEKELEKEIKKKPLDVKVEYLTHP